MAEMAPKEHRSKFRIFNRFSRNKTSLTTGATLTGTSAVVGEISQSDNSAATSKNLQAASVKLHDYVETLDLNDSMPPDVVSMSRWIEKAEKFSNSSYGDGALLREASISNSHRGLIELAAISSKLVYAGAPEALKHFSLIRFTPAGPVINLSPDALFGTIKAADIRLFNGDVNGDGHLTPFIVVAIRGTASVRDWTVNFNHGVNETVHTEFLGQTVDEKPYKVHTGFLQSAEQSSTHLPDSILKLLLDPCLSNMPNPPQLLFTGHSAGGAVASMLYAHMLATRKCPSSLQSLTSKLSAIHLITFGAPPVTLPPIPSPSRLLASSPPGLGTGRIRERQAFNHTAFYAIINEGDPVPRADQKYIDALLRVFVSVGPPKSPPLSTMADPSLSSQLAGISLDGRGKQGPICPLPEMELKNAGTLLLIRKRDSPGTTRFWNVPEEGNEGSLQSMLFGNPRMHRMLTYLERLGICQ